MRWPNLHLEPPKTFDSSQGQSFDNPVVSPRPNQPGLTVWTLNVCTLRSKDLLLLTQAFSDNSNWDALCIQEGTTTIPPGVHTESRFWFLTGEQGTVGSPHLILNSRLGARLRRTKFHSHYILAEIGTVPPVILFTVYLPH